MGSAQYGPPPGIAKNTSNCYKGKLSDLFETQTPFLLYNPIYKEYLFVSNDKKDRDHIVESHPYRNEKRNQFHLVKIPGLYQNEDQYAIYNATYGEYLFVSNDKSANDHIVEAHPYTNENRNIFQINLHRDYLYKIYNSQYHEYIFVSNDTKDNDHVVLSHPYPNEERNLFEIQVIDIFILDVWGEGLIETDDMITGFKNSMNINEENQLISNGKNTGKSIPHFLSVKGYESPKFPLPDKSAKNCTLMGAPIVYSVISEMSRVLDSNGFVYLYDLTKKDIYTDMIRYGQFQYIGQKFVKELDYPFNTIRMADKEKTIVQIFKKE